MIQHRIEEFAKIFKLSPEAVRNLIRQGEIPAVRIGKQYRITQDVVDRYFAQALSPEERGFGIKILDSPRYRIYYTAVTRKELLAKPNLSSTERYRIRMLLLKHRLVSPDEQIAEYFFYLLTKYSDHGPKVKTGKLPSYSLIFIIFPITKLTASV